MITLSTQPVRDDQMEAVILGRHYVDNPFATADKKFLPLVASSKGHLSSDCGHKVCLIGIHYGHFLHKGLLAENPVLLGLSGYTGKVEVVVVVGWGEVLLMRRKMYVDEGRCERNEIHCSLGGEFRKVAYEIDV